VLTFTRPSLPEKLPDNRELHLIAIFFYVGMRERDLSPQRVIVMRHFFVMIALIVLCHFMKITESPSDLAVGGTRGHPADIWPESSGHTQSILSVVFL